MAHYPYVPYGGCRETCPDPGTVQVPGPSGASGADGAAGAPGINAYSVVTASFTMPLPGASVEVTVTATAWMSVGQMLWVEHAGNMSVASVSGANSAYLYNPAVDGAYAGNAAAGTTIPTGSKVSPAGIQGVAGGTEYSASGDIELDGSGAPRLAITASVGDILVNGNATTAPRNTRLAAGTDATVLHADSGAASGLGLEWRGIDLSGADSALSGQLPVNLGGTGASDAGGARTNLGAAASGANSDITALAGLTTPLSVAQGGNGVGAWPLCRATKNGTSQSVASNSYTALSFGTKSFDPWGSFDTGTGRFQPATAGVYRLTAAAFLVQLEALQSFQVFIYRNGSSYAASPLVRNWRTAGVADVSTAVTCLAAANGSTDYFTVVVYFTDSGSVWKEVSGLTHLTWFEAERAGPQSA